MLVYQLDAKLKRGFNFFLGNFRRSASRRAQTVETQQSIGFGLSKHAIGNGQRREYRHRLR